MGHRRIAVMTGEPYASTGRDRTAGFLKSAPSAAWTCPRAGAFPALRHRRRPQRRRRPAGRPGPPTAIFAVNDFLAVGVMGAARERGLEAGRDVAIVGYNDTRWPARCPSA